MVQEHWLFDSQLDLLVQFCSFGVSGMDDSLLGGCGIIYHKRLSDISKQFYPTNYQSSDAFLGMLGEIEGFQHHLLVVIFQC